MIFLLENPVDSELFERLEKVDVVTQVLLRRRRRRSIGLASGGISPHLSLHHFESNNENLDQFRCNRKL
jgi:hypothetical protein